MSATSCRSCDAALFGKTHVRIVPQLQHGCQGTQRVCCAAWSAAVAWVGSDVSQQEEVHVKALPKGVSIGSIILQRSGATQLSLLDYT